MSPDALETVVERSARKAYGLVVLVLLPLLALYLLHRGRRQSAYRQHWRERFWGGGAGERAFWEGAGPIVWLHAVSVGETQAAEPLLRAWLDQAPALRLVLSHTTPTGRETGARLFADLPADRFQQVYLPYDWPGAVGRFLDWAQPSLGILMETELWPNLLHEAARRGLPMALINGRLSKKSARQMQRFSALARPSLNRLQLLLAQTEADAQRFQRQGYSGHLQVTGSLKFDVPLDAAQIDRGQAWRSTWPHQRVWLVASSREDEEAALFAAWKDRWLGGVEPFVQPPLLLVVPRHPQRFDRVAALAEAQGLRLARRSASEAFALDGVDVLLGDSLGEMQAYVAASDLVLVGGSLLPLGGQNPLEACAQGRPVFFGPSMFNFQAIARALKACGAGQEVLSVEEFLSAAEALSADAAAYARAAEAAKAFSQAHRGASQRSLAALQDLLSA